MSSIADVCRHEQVQAVVYSHMPRAALPAKELADSLGVTAGAQQGLQERDFGSWNSWKWPEIAIELNKLSLEERYTFKPPNGESWQQMDARLKTALNDIAALGHESIAVVTHAGPIRVLLVLLESMSKVATIKLVPALGACYVESYDPEA